MRRAVAVGILIGRAVFGGVSAEEAFLRAGKIAGFGFGQIIAGIGGFAFGCFVGRAIQCFAADKAAVGMAGATVAGECFLANVAILVETGGSVAYIGAGVALLGAGERIRRLFFKRGAGLGGRTIPFDGFAGRTRRRNTDIAGFLPESVTGIQFVFVFTSGTMAMLGTGVKRIVGYIASRAGRTASAATSAGKGKRRAGADGRRAQKDDAGIDSAGFFDNLAALHIGIVMAGDADRRAELEQKLVGGIIFMLLGDANCGVLGGVIFDIYVLLELFQAGDIGIFCPQIQVIRRQPGCRRCRVYVYYHNQG